MKRDDTSSVHHLGDELDELERQIRRLRKLIAEVKVDTAGLEELTRRRRAAR